MKSSIRDAGSDAAAEEIITLHQHQSRTRPLAIAAFAPVALLPNEEVLMVSPASSPSDTLVGDRITQPRTQRQARHQQSLVADIFLLPYVVFLLLFGLLPGIFALILSFPPLRMEHQTILRLAGTILCWPLPIFVLARL